MPIQNIIELFALEGRDFVADAYRNILNREPDPQGMAYYLGRLAMGCGKASVITDLAQSKEARPRHEIAGLPRLIQSEKRANYWLLGRFGRWRRQETLLREGIQELAKVKKSMDDLHDILRRLPLKISEANDTMRQVSSSIASCLMESGQIATSDSTNANPQSITTVSDSAPPTSFQTNFHERDRLPPYVRDVFNDLKAAVSHNARVGL